MPNYQFFGENAEEIGKQALETLRRSGTFQQLEELLGKKYSSVEIVIGPDITVLTDRNERTGPRDAGNAVEFKKPDGTRGARVYLNTTSTMWENEPDAPIGRAKMIGHYMLEQVLAHELGHLKRDDITSRTDAEREEKEEEANRFMNAVSAEVNRNFGEPLFHTTRNKDYRARQAFQINRAAKTFQGLGPPFAAPLEYFENIETPAGRMPVRRDVPMGTYDPALRVQVKGLQFGGSPPQYRTLEAVSRWRGHYIFDTDDDAKRR